MAAVSDLYATAAGKNVRCHNVGDTVTYAEFPILMLNNQTAAVKALLRQGGFHLDNDKVGNSANSHALARRIADAAGIVLYA